MALLLGVSHLGNLCNSIPKDFGYLYRVMSQSSSSSSFVLGRFSVAFGDRTLVFGFRRVERAEIRRSPVKIIEVYSTMLRAHRPPKMPILAPLVLVLLFAAGIFFTGCTSLVRGFNRVRAEMTKPATDEETHNYGAFFTTPRSLTSDGPTK